MSRLKRRLISEETSKNKRLADCEIDTFSVLMDKNATPEHEVKVSTLEGRVESQGKTLTSAYMEKAVGILESYGIDAQSGIIDNSSPVTTSVRNTHLPEVLSESTVRQLIIDYNRDRGTDTKLKFGLVTSTIETSAEDCCYISIDDIGVRFQKEERNSTYKKKQKFIENTVIHIQKGERHEECLRAYQRSHGGQPSCVPHRWCQLYP